MERTTAVGAVSEKRKLIARSAATLFHDQGYHETSVDDIAGAVNLKKPTLYHYVQSKGEILYWIHDELMTELQRPLTLLLAEEIPAGQALLRIAVDILRVIETHPAYLRVFFENYRQLPDEYRTLVRLQREAYFNGVQQVISRGIGDAELRAISPRLTTYAFFGMCNWTYQWYRPEVDGRPEDVGAVLCDLFLTGSSSSRSLPRQHP